MKTTDGVALIRPAFFVVFSRMEAKMDCHINKLDALVPRTAWNKGRGSNVSFKIDADSRLLRL